jgi:hypothetical protein
MGSILLVLVAACMLGVGAVRGSDTFYYLSIVSSVLAALVLIVSLRPGREGRLPDADFDVGRNAVSSRYEPLRPGRAPDGRAGIGWSGHGRAGIGWSGHGLAGLGWRGVWAALVRADRARQDVMVPESNPDGHGSSAAEPPDEPPAQALTTVAAARMARLETEVAVIDGRPRYHLAGCLHLLGREVERLPVMEAVELGFTPCCQCEPATELLARSLGP